MTTKKKPALGAIRGTDYGSSFDRCNHTATHDVANRKVAFGIFSQRVGMSPSPRAARRRLSPVVRLGEILSAVVWIQIGNKVLIESHRLGAPI